MKGRHGFLIAVVLGAAAVAGTWAALQTVSLGADASSPSEQEIAQADVRLDRQEAQLRRAAERRPPELPALPAPAQGTTDDPGVLEVAAGCPMGAIAVYDAASGEREA